MSERTVIEVARRAAGLSQYELARRAGTSQSSVSEYESRRKSPTLEVVERLLESAGAQLVVRPWVFFERFDDPVTGRFYVTDRLWSVPVPQCFARVEVLAYILPVEVTAAWATQTRIWDLSNEAERVEYYSLALRHAFPEALEDTVDAVLLTQAWSRLDLPDLIREAWQPLIDAASGTQSGPARDPGGMNVRIVHEMDMLARERGQVLPPKLLRRWRSKGRS